MFPLAGDEVPPDAEALARALEGREFSLTPFVPAGLSPRHITVLVEQDGIRVRAVLGGSAGSGG